MILWLLLLTSAFLTVVLVVAVLSRGGDGCVQKDFQDFLRGFGPLEARSICRMLDRTNKVEVDARARVML